LSLLASQRYALGRALAMVRDRPLAFFLGVVLAGSAIAVPLAMASIGWSARPALARVQPAPEISVFLSTRATSREAEALKVRLAQVPGVAAVTLKPKDEALAELLRKSELASTPADLGPNPLPDVLIVHPGLPVSPEALEGIVADVRGWPLVDTVRSDLDWYRKVLAIGRLLTAGVVVFGGLVMLLVTLILVGTVRLHAGTRADEVAILRLVGATNRFIVRPYAYSAALTLLLAAGFAVGVVFLAALYGAPFTLPDPELVYILVVVCGAVAFGWLVGALGARSTLTGR
jgi:cell division transport system permease protein